MAEVLVGKNKPQAQRFAFAAGYLGWIGRVTAG